MEICFNSEDQQISKLSQSSLIAYRIQKVGRDAHLGLGKFKSSKPSSRGDGGAKFFMPASKEVSLATNGSFEPPAQGSCDAPAVSSSFFPESLLSEKGKIVGQALVDPATLSESGRCQSPSKGVQATTAQSDGESHESRPQRSSPTIKHQEVSTQFAKGATEASGSSSQP